MRTVAYIRVLTNNQDLDQQRLAILDYAHRHRLTIDEFVKVEVSSRKNLRQRGISQSLERLDPKDVLLVSELSRLGRSVSQIILLVDRMIEKQIRFVAVKEGIDLEGVQDIQTKVTVTMFASFTDDLVLRFGLFAAWVECEAYRNHRERFDLRTDKRGTGSSQSKREDYWKTQRFVWKVKA